MKAKAFAQVLLLLSFSQGFMSSSAMAIVRIMPRSDYGEVGRFNPIRRPFDLLHLVNPIADRINGIGDNLNSQRMGGHFDLVYQQVGDQTQIYRCPTLRNCLTNPNVNMDYSSYLATLIETSSTADKKSTQISSNPELDKKIGICAADPQFWNCQLLIDAPKDKMCKRFRTTYRYLLFKNLIVTNVIGSIVEAPITFLNEGFTGQANDALNVVQNVGSLNDISEAKCTTGSMDLAIHNSSSPDLQKTIFVLHEKEKEQLSVALGAFMKDLDWRSTNQLSDAQKMQAGGYYRQGFLNLQNMDEQGAVPFENAGPVQHRQ